MAQWNRHERWVVTEMREQAVYKTECIYSEWFETGHGPELYKQDELMQYWVPTNDYVIAQEKPK